MKISNFKNQKDLVLIDLSWLMFNRYWALNDLSFIYKGDPKPSGHIYGVVKTVIEIKKRYETVLLCADSKTIRKRDSSYKANREKMEYNLFQDLNIILILCTYLPGVYYIKEEGYEADDIINTIVNLGGDPIIYGNDKDLLQSKHPFRISNRMDSNGFVFQDKQEYIRSSMGIDLPYLPIWYKVIKGDKSDNIGISVLRLNKQILIDMVMALKDTQSWEDFLEYVKHIRNKKWRTQIQADIEKVKRNYDLIIPFYLKEEDIKLKRMGHSLEDVMLLLNYTQMFSLKEHFK